MVGTFDQKLFHHSYLREFIVVSTRSTLRRSPAKTSCSSDVWLTHTVTSSPRTIESMNDTHVIFLLSSFLYVIQGRIMKFSEDLQTSVTTLGLGRWLAAEHRWHSINAPSPPPPPYVTAFVQQAAGSACWHLHSLSAGSHNTILLYHLPLHSTPLNAYPLPVL